MLVLDSTVLIDCLRGRPASERVLKIAQGGEILATTPVNVEEIVRGLLPGEESSAEALFGGLQVITLRLEHGHRAGRWRGQFARTGVTLSQADCLIAAAAHLSAATLATGNPDHFPMTELRVEHWPVGR